MKPGWSTHLLALTAGVLGVVVWRAHGAREIPDQAGSAGENGGTFSSTAEAQSRATARARRERNGQVLAALVAESRRDFETPSLEPAERWRRMKEDEAQALADLPQRLARIQEMSRRWKGEPDLGPPLLEAAQSGDHEQLYAVLLEWRRRDPAALFRQLVQRYATWDALTDPLFSECFPDQDIQAQFQQIHRSPEVCLRSLAMGYGEKLARHGSVTELHQALAALGGSTAGPDLAESFVAHWLPASPDAAVRDLIQAATPEARPLLLTALIHGEEPPCMATGGFAQALTALDWQESEKMKGDSSGALVDRAPPSVPTFSSKLENADAPETACDALNGILNAERIENASDPLRLRDYSSLMRQKRMTPDEAHAAIVQEIPGADRFPQQVDDAICQQFMAVDPTGLVDWGQSHGVPAEHLRDAAKGLMTKLSATGQIRLAKAAERIDGWPWNYDNLSGFIPCRWDESNYPDAFDFWQQVNPTAAAEGVQRLPERWRPKAAESR